MGAEGYTTGRDVGFGSSNPSLHTAAHEAAHVVQQRAGIQLKGGVGEAGDVYEQHADRVADLVVAGRSAESELSRFAGGGSGGVSHATGVQQKLKLTGDKANTDRALAVMNKGLFGFTAKLDGKGYVTLEAKQPRARRTPGSRRCMITSTGSFLTPPMSWSMSSPGPRRWWAAMRPARST